MRVSPWSGLTSTQTNVLANAVEEPQRRRMPLHDAYADVFAEFSGRTVTLLMGNDLRGALDAAAVAYHAQTLALGGRRNCAREIPSSNQRVVAQSPAAAKSGVPPRLRDAQAFKGGAA